MYQHWLSYLSYHGSNIIKILFHFELQIDSLDDFAIIDGQSVLSLHQVKAKRTKLYSSHKKDFIKQNDKLIQWNAQKAFFHVSQLISDLPGTFNKSYPKTQIYTYRHPDGKNNNYCGLGDINRCIEIQLKNALKQLGAATYKLEDNYLELNRICLEEVICTQVILIHKEIQENGTSKNEAAYRKTIYLSQFFEILSQDIVSRMQGDEYWAYLLKSEYGLCLLEFCHRNSSISNEELLTLNHFASFVNSLNSAQLLSFNASVVPHKTNSFTDSKTLNFKNGTFDKEDLKVGFFKLLKGINKTNAIKSVDGSRFYWLFNNEKLYPTAIYRNADDAEDVCRDILESSLEKEEQNFFERDKLINQYIDCENIFSNSLDSRHRVFDLEDEYKEMPQDKIFNFKRISLISLEKAKELLNE